MKKIFLICLCACFCLSSATAWAKKKKAAVCHKGKTIWVAKPAVKAHIRHGDHMGACRPPQKAPPPKAVEIREFNYYPSIGVYFDVKAGVYFYMRDGKWISGPTLPKTIVIKGLSPVTVKLDGPEPHLHHKEIIVKYPPPPKP